MHLLFRTPTDPYARFVSVASFTGALYVFALMVFAVPGPMVLHRPDSYLPGSLYHHFWLCGNASGVGEYLLREESSRWIPYRLRSYAASPWLQSLHPRMSLLSDTLLTTHTQKRQSIFQCRKFEHSLQQQLLSINRFSSRHLTRAYQLAAEIGIAQMNQIATDDTTLTPTQAQQQFQAALSQSVQSALWSQRRLVQIITRTGQCSVRYTRPVVPLNIDGAYQNAKDAYNHAIAL